MRIIEVCVPYSFLAHVNLDNFSSMPNKLLGCCCSVLSNSFLTAWTVAHQVLLSIEFPRQKCCSGLTFSSPGDFHDPRIKPISPALAGGFSPTEPQGSPWYWVHGAKMKLPVWLFPCPVAPSLRLSHSLGIKSQPGFRTSLPSARVHTAQWSCSKVNLFCSFLRLLTILNISGT